MEYLELVVKRLFSTLKIPCTVDLDPELQMLIVNGLWAEVGKVDGERVTFAGIRKCKVDGFVVGKINIPRGTRPVDEEPVVIGTYPNAMQAAALLATTWFTERLTDAVHAVCTQLTLEEEGGMGE